MLKRRTFLQAATAVTATWATRAVASPAKFKWVVYYGETADEQVLAGYDLVVLDPSFKGSVAAVKRNGSRVCGYLSLGETRQSDLYKQIDEAALLAQNPTWNTRQIDVRHPSYRDTVVNKMIPAVVAQGYTGLMLDTLDTPPYLEALGKQAGGDKYHGMTDAAVDLVQAIRSAHPRLKLLVNRGYALLPRIINNIDAVIAESLLTSPGGGGYEWNTPASVAQQLSLLTIAQDRHVPVLSLDYWEPTDAVSIGKIYLRERLLNHHPYVATHLLDTIVPEPLDTSVAWKPND